MKIDSPLFHFLCLAQANKDQQFIIENITKMSKDKSKDNRERRMQRNNIRSKKSDNRSNNNDDYNKPKQINASTVAD